MKNLSFFHPVVLSAVFMCDIRANNEYRRGVVKRKKKNGIFVVKKVGCYERKTMDKKSLISHCSVETEGRISFHLFTGT